MNGGRLVSICVVDRYIVDNDRGDEDPSERPHWIVVVEATLVFDRPLQQIAFTHKVEL